MKTIKTHRQCIRTRYIPASNTRGSRVRASYAGGSIVRSWDDALSVDDNHAAVALELAVNLGWGAASDFLVGGWFNHEAYWVLIDCVEDLES